MGYVELPGPEITTLVDKAEGLDRVAAKESLEELIEGAQGLLDLIESRMKTGGRLREARLYKA